MGSHAAPIEAIETTVADCENATVHHLPPLREWIDSDTLTTLTTRWGDQTEPLELSYLWYSVTIYPEGDVTVTLPEND